MAASRALGDGIDWSTATGEQQGGKRRCAQRESSYLTRILRLGRLQAEAISKAREVVEEADDVRHFEASAVIEAQCP